MKSIEQLLVKIIGASVALILLADVLRQFIAYLIVAACLAFIGRLLLRRR